MTPIEARLTKLAAELQREWSFVEQHLARAQSVDPSSSGPDAAYVALALDHAYQAFETLLLRTDRSMGLPERSGDRWHIELLDDARLALPGLRPPVYPDVVARDWHALLRFRHFLRHAYAADLDPEELDRNTSRLERAVVATAPVLASLVAALLVDRPRDLPVDGQG